LEFTKCKHGNHIKVWHCSCLKTRNPWPISISKGCKIIKFNFGCLVELGFLVKKTIPSLALFHPQFAVKWEELGTVCWNWVSGHKNCTIFMLSRLDLYESIWVAVKAQARPIQNWGSNSCEDQFRWEKSVWSPLILDLWAYGFSPDFWFHPQFWVN
jgi:hypothetical protein